MEISRDNLKKHVSYLASPELNGRAFASEEGKLAAQYVQEHFREYALVPPAKYADFLQELPWGGQNVLGILYGGEAEFAKECVIIDAHQDHVGNGFAGASDNAAGMAILLELARSFANSREKMKRSILFACFDGEELILNINGKKQLMQGATYYVQNPAFDLKKTFALLTLDTLGRKFLFNEMIFILGVERSLSLQSIVDECTTSLSKIMFSIDLLTGVMGNYVPFVDKKIPSLFISNGVHKDYHGRGDTAEKLSYDLLYDDSLFMIELITKLANSENKLDFCKNKISPAGEAEDILRLLILLREALSESDPSISGKLDFIIDRLRNSPTRKEMKQAVQILLGFVTPNFARLYLLLNAAQIAEREKNYDEALKYYNEILVLDSEYRVPYLWLQEIRDKIANLEKRIAN
jgi:hypothetical protein